MLMGVYSAAGTLGRIVGTLVTGTLFAFVHIQSPYAMSALLMLCVFVVARSVQTHWREHMQNPD
jgi:predicted MFS family arabinose efflux permease